MTHDLARIEVLLLAGLAAWSLGNCVLGPLVCWWFTW